MLTALHNPLLPRASSQTVKRRTLRLDESPRRRLDRARRGQSAVKQIGRLPAVGEEIVMIMTGDFHGWDIVGAVLDLAGVAAAHLRVATLGFNRSQTIHLASLLDAGRVRRLTMAVSEMFREKNKSEYALLAAEMQSRGQTVKCGRNHAKLMLFELADGRRIAVHGSLNLRRCNSFEQVAISASVELHDFFAAFIDGLAL